MKLLMMVMALALFGGYYAAVKMPKQSNHLQTGQAVVAEQTFACVTGTDYERYNQYLHANDMAKFNRIVDDPRCGLITAGTEVNVTKADHGNGRAKFSYRGSEFVISKELLTQ